MTRIHLRHVDRFVDRHGHVRHYFRRPGGKRIPLPGLPGSKEFMASYKTALAGEDAPAAEPKTRGQPGTFSRLATQYFASPEFLRLRIRTQYATASLLNVSWPNTVTGWSPKCGVMT